MVREGVFRWGYFILMVVAAAAIIATSMGFLIRHLRVVTARMMMAMMVAVATSTITEP